MATVKHVEDQDGNHSIGVDIAGVFVPFVTIDKVRAQDRVTALHSPKAATVADDAAKGDKK